MPGRRARKKANYTNMSRRELHNIKMMVAPPIHTDHQKDKLERKALSDARVAQWPNTLEAMRRNKDLARERRLEAEEAERLKEDKRLAAARAQERKIRIERANRMIYEKTDRMKVLKSQLMFADIVAHRDRQVEEKKYWGAMEKEMDGMWHQEIIRQCKEYDVKEAKEEAARKAKFKDIAAVQTRQLEEYKNAYIEQLRQEREEGIKIAEECVREVAEEKAKMQRIKDRDIANMVATRKGNEKLQELRKEFAKKEALEDAAIAKYAADKEKMQKMRSEREQEQFDRAQRKRQKIIDDAVAAMAAFSNQEETILAKQQAEARAKEDAKFADKARKQQEMRDAIEESRKMQNDMRQKQKDEDDALATEMQRRWKLRNEQLNADEKRERKEKRDNARAYQAFLLKQAEEKKRERREEREGSLRQAKIAQQVSAEEEGRFFDEVRKALQKMEPGLNNHSVKKCFNLKEKLQEAW